MWYLAYKKEGSYLLSMRAFQCPCTTSPRARVRSVHDALVTCTQLFVVFVGFRGDFGWRGQT